MRRGAALVGLRGRRRCCKAGGGCCLQLCPELRCALLNCVRVHPAAPQQPFLVLEYWLDNLTSAVKESDESHNLVIWLHILARLGKIPSQFKPAADQSGGQWRSPLFIQFVLKLSHLQIYLPLPCVFQNIRIGLLVGVPHGGGQVCWPRHSGALTASPTQVEAVALHIATGSGAPSRQLQKHKQVPVALGKHKLQRWQTSTSGCS